MGARRLGACAQDQGCSGLVPVNLLRVIILSIFSLGVLVGIIGAMLAK